MKAVPVDWKKVSNIGDNEVLKKTKFNTLKTKLNKIDYKTPDATTLIQINQHNTDKQCLEKKLGILIKKYPTLMF